MRGRNPAGERRVPAGRGGRRVGYEHRDGQGRRAGLGGRRVVRRGQARREDGRVVRGGRRVGRGRAEPWLEQLDAAVAGVKHGKQAAAAVRHVVGRIKHAGARPSRPERPDQRPVRAVRHDAVVASVGDQYAALRVGLDPLRARQPLRPAGRQDVPARPVEHQHAPVLRVRHHDAAALVGGDARRRVHGALDAGSARPDHKRGRVVEIGLGPEVPQAGPRRAHPARVAVRDALEHPDAVVSRVGDDDAAAGADVDGGGEPEHAAGAAERQDMDAVRAEHLYAVVPCVGHDDVAGGPHGHPRRGRQVGVRRAPRAERALVRAVPAEHLHPAVARVGYDVAPIGGDCETLREAQTPVGGAAHRERPRVRAVPAEHLHAVVDPVGYDDAAAGVDVHAPRLVELPVGGA